MMALLFSLFPGLPLPSLSFSICLSPGKDQQLRASRSIQSLPFLEGFLSGVLWDPGIRDTVGSFLSKKETASWERRVGRDGQKQQELGHKNVQCSWVLPSAILSLAEGPGWVRGGHLHLSEELWCPVGIFWTRKIKSHVPFPIADAVSLPQTCEEEEGSCWLPEALSTFCPG